MDAPSFPPAWTCKDTLFTAAGKSLAAMERIGRVPEGGQGGRSIAPTPEAMRVVRRDGARGPRREDFRPILADEV
jgi:plasmid stabilization system protein ParE